MRDETEVIFGFWLDDEEDVVKSAKARAIEQGYEVVAVKEVWNLWKGFWRVRVEVERPKKRVTT